MRIQEIITEATPNSSEFRRWFAGSKVVDKFNQPLRCFHGTVSDFTLPFKEFTHFGTAKAADHRIYGTHGTVPDAVSIFQNARVFPVFLCIKKPYQFSDTKKNGYSDVLRKMLRDNIIQHDEVEQLRATSLSGWGNANFLHEECGKVIIAKLSALGFDGLSYINKHEDAGNKSWVVFHSTQVWHEFA